MVIGLGQELTLRVEATLVLFHFDASYLVEKPPIVPKILWHRPNSLHQCDTVLLTVGTSLLSHFRSVIVCGVRKAVLQRCGLRFWENGHGVYHCNLVPNDHRGVFVLQCDV